MSWTYTTYACGLSLLLGLVACGPSGGGDDAADSERARTRIDRYLQGETYRRLEVETDYVEGTKPSSDLRSELAQEFEGLVEKPGGVSFPADETLESRGSEHVWTLEELDQLASNHAQSATDGETARMYTVFVDGSYEEDDGDSKVLGLAWKNRYMAIFRDNIESSCSGGSGGVVGNQLCRLAIKSIWTHEIGHTLGLVDNGISPQADHLDEDHGHHCDNDECVMYWKYERDDLIGLLRERLQRGNTEALDFDRNCRDDLMSVREPSGDSN